MAISRYSLCSALTAGLSLFTTSLPVAAQEPEVPPGESSPVEMPPVDRPAASAVDGPIVHVVIKNPDSSKGAVKLARYKGGSQAALPGANAVVLTTYYDEICTVPCGVAVDVSERPMFFFMRDGNAVSRRFRLNDLTGDVTLKVKTERRGLAIAGTTTLILLIGIPMVIAAASKVWLAKGPPSPGQTFTKLKKARQ